MDPAPYGLTKSGKPRVRLPGGGAKPKDRVTRPRSVSLYDDEVEFLRQLGGGEIMGGLRLLIERAREGAGSGPIASLALTEQEELLLKALGSSSLRKGFEALLKAAKQAELPGVNDAL